MTQILTAKFSQILPRWIISPCYELIHSKGKFVIEVEDNPLSKTVAGYHNFLGLYYDYKLAYCSQQDLLGVRKHCVVFDIPESITKKIQGKSFFW
jgi:hypothetical protein